VKSDGTDQVLIFGASGVRLRALVVLAFATVATHTSASIFGCGGSPWANIAGATLRASFAILIVEKIPIPLKIPGQGSITLKTFPGLVK
jgi:hypothetical protein